MADEQPRIADTAPVEVEVEAGDVIWWCMCGRSATQPRCDGSHAGTDFRPLKYDVEEDGTLWFCACKRTSTPPLCDGTHNNL